MSVRAYTANTLLLRDDVGRAKPSHYDLPGDDFVYGKKLRPDKEDCKAGLLKSQLVTMSWKFHDFSNQAKAPRDFRKLNKQTIQEGLSNTKVMKND